MSASGPSGPLVVIVRAMRLDTIDCCCLGYCTGNAIGYFRLLLFVYCTGNAIGYCIFLLFGLLHGQCDWIQ